MGPVLAMGLWEEERSTAVALSSRGQPVTLGWNQGQRAASAQFLAYLCPERLCSEPA